MKYLLRWCKFHSRGELKTYLKAMKIIAFLLVIGLMQVQASGYSQDKAISITLQDELIADAVQ